MSNNKVTWIKSSEGNYVKVFEDNEWKHYTKSKLYKGNAVDGSKVGNLKISSYSKGFPLFIAARNAGYELVVTVPDETLNNFKECVLEKYDTVDCVKLDDDMYQVHIADYDLIKKIYRNEGDFKCSSKLIMEASGYGMEGLRFCVNKLINNEEVDFKQLFNS